MSADEFVDRWLMLGTEAKAGNDDVPAEDRNGLPQRPRQGQKGIGRLSVAYLGPTVLVLTKRSGHQFVASLIDWRLFQNPYLTLDDVKVPLEEFSDTREFPKVLGKLFDGLVGNLWGDSDDPDRKARLEAAWRRFSADEMAGGGVCSADDITALALVGVLDDRHVSTWQAWTGAEDSGTALFVFDVGHELRVWVDRSLADEDPEIKEIRDNLRLTLTGFVDPFTEMDGGFSYEVAAHRDTSRHQIVSSDEVFDIHDLRDLEHVVEGRFDSAGMFTDLLQSRRSRSLSRRPQSMIATHTKCGSAYSLVRALSAPVHTPCSSFQLSYSARTSTPATDLPVVMDLNTPATSFRDQPGIFAHRKQY